MSKAGGLQYPHGANYAVAAPVLALSAGAVELVAFDAHRIFELEGLYRGVEGVAHPDVDAGGTGAFLTCSLAAADGLVVGPARAADDRVVHRPLALRGQRGGLECAARTTSAMRLVSTFPATTAEGLLAFTRLPSGARISSGA